MFAAGLVRYPTAVAEAIPRYSEANGGRQHLRMLLALGILAGTAIASASLGALIGNDDPSDPAVAGDPTDVAKAALGPVTGELLDPATLLERRVLEAEHSVYEARTALRRAREAGVDQNVIERFERRLEILGESSLERVRRNFDEQAAQEEPQAAHLQPAHVRPRSL